MERPTTSCEGQSERIGRLSCDVWPVDIISLDPVLDINWNYAPWQVPKVWMFYTSSTDPFIYFLWKPKTQFVKVLIRFFLKKKK